MVAGLAVPACVHTQDGRVAVVVKRVSTEPGLLLDISPCRGALPERGAKLP